jgi:hypothetical protein
VSNAGGVPRTAQCVSGKTSAHVEREHGRRFDAAGERRRRDEPRRHRALLRFPREADADVQRLDRLVRAAPRERVGQQHRAVESG